MEKSKDLLYNTGAYEIIMAVDELHKQGYEQLRLLPGMSPNGCAWRWNIYPRCTMGRNNFFECNGYGEVVIYNVSNIPHGSTNQTKSGIAISDVVNALKILFPDVIEKGHQPDQKYVEWFKYIVEGAKQDQYVIAFGEYFDVSKGWELAHEKRIPCPPYLNKDEMKKFRMKDCRYYKGENDCPQGIDFFCWEAECIYCNATIKDDSSHIKDYRLFYKYDENKKFQINYLLLTYLWAMCCHLEAHADKEPSKEAFENHFMPIYLQKKKK